MVACEAEQPPRGEILAEVYRLKVGDDCDSSSTNPGDFYISIELTTEFARPASATAAMAAEGPIDDVVAEVTGPIDAIYDVLVQAHDDEDIAIDDIWVAGPVAAEPGNAFAVFMEFYENDPGGPQWQDDAWLWFAWDDEDGCWKESDRGACAANPYVLASGFMRFYDQTTCQAEAYFRVLDEEYLPAE
jgi:hypothetical protein